MQKTLSADQLSEFYINVFVDDQARDFKLCFSDEHSPIAGVILDMGGGVGYFANAIKQDFPNKVRVVEMDLVSVENCRERGLEAEIGDATNYVPKGDEDVVCFNLILHHLVANTEADTRRLQLKALHTWQGNSQRLFVNEYTYESHMANLSGWLIYQITSSRFLSTIGKAVSKVIPSLRANTFGTGVRFRSHEEWTQIFADAGFLVTKSIVGINEHVALPLRLLLIKNIRRDTHCQVFFPWYNDSHRHSGIGYMTPAALHHGQAQALFVQRAKTLDAAFAANPIRFKRNCPQPPKLPVAAWINPPKKEADLNKKSTDCTLN